MRKRPFYFLFISVITLISLISLIVLFDPNFQFQISNFKFQIPYLILPLLFLFLFSTFTYLLKKKAHGLLIASFTLVYLLFRLNDLTHPFFLIILLALFLTVELLVSYRK